MIAKLTGKLAYKCPQHVIIDVNGVGYRVLVSFNSFSSLPEVNETVDIFTHTYLREDQLTLYGFVTPEEKEIFQKFISVSGVGPKMALTILSGTKPAEIAQAICNENTGFLQSIPGVGQKTAKRIVIELKDKMKNYMSAETEESRPLADRLYDDVLSALTNLGYQRALAEKAIKKCAWDEKTTLENAIRDTLKEISQR
jgi:Holliday junction DNA helicase RuvA